MSGQPVKDTIASGPDPPVNDMSLQTIASGPGPPVGSRTMISPEPPSPAEDAPEWVDGREVEGDDGWTEEKSTLKPTQATFESKSEGSAETEIPDVVREGVAETAPPIQAVTRDGKDKIVLTSDWLVETVEDGTSLRLLIQKKDGFFEARKFPSS